MEISIRYTLDDGRFNLLTAGDDTVISDMPEYLQTVIRNALQLYNEIEPVIRPYNPRNRQRPFDWDEMRERPFSEAINDPITQMGLVKASRLAYADDEAPIVDTLFDAVIDKYFEKRDMCLQVLVEEKSASLIALAARTLWYPKRRWHVRASKAFYEAFCIDNLKEMPSYDIDEVIDDYETQNMVDCWFRNSRRITEKPITFVIEIPRI